jgi:hypothetical protein
MASAGCRRSIGYFHIDIAEVQTEDGKLHKANASSS